MANLQSLNTAFMRPIFSPRSEMSRYMNDIQKNKTSLIINIDKQTLALFKNEFQNNDNKIDKLNFVATGLKILKSWQKDMQYRQSRIVAYLLSLFQEIQNKVQGICITWEQFNNLIIEKALNLKTLQSHDSEAISQLKHVNWSRGKTKLLTPLQKIVCLNKEKKIAFLCEQSNKIQFLNMHGSQHNFKPLVIQRQDLMVQKTLVKRVKNQGTRAIVKQNYKKDVIVSGYSITFLDMIYVSNDRYQMLITSSSDGIIRGWDIQGNIPTLAKQPENQQQKMLHQFSLEIHSMAWDQINDVLYCSAKDSKIYIWIVKTDSQKQLSDPDGHQAMISSIIMMPKLQFLATGDYEGKLILWDTISMNKKYKYQQHTRSIVSMTFHQTLILLFTASFDHSICVWNPYIPSLIYKISCNLNVIQVHIIKGTNYLAALDTGSNLKIRQINKFNLISTYVVDRPQDNDVIKGQEAKNNQFIKIQPTCMAVSQDSSTKFFFGGNSIKCMQFDENQALTASQYYPTFLKYNSDRMKMYVVIKNTILIWDMLNGQLHDILQSQSDQQITAIDLIQNSGRFVVGDTSGSIYIRKLESGIKISRIYKHRNKTPISHLTSKRGGIWNQSIIISCFQDGQIVVFGKDQSFDYNLLRSFNIRKYFTNAFILAVEYEQKRNICMLATNLGDVICYDIDKTRILNHIQAKGLEVFKFVLKPSIPSVLAFGKNNQVLGLYLPPHSKKYKLSCNLSIASSQNQQKISCLTMCKLNNQCFVGYENGTITKFLLSQHYINNQQVSNKNITKVSPQWQCKFTQIPKDIILILNESVLAIIFHMKNITFLQTKNGQVLNILPSFAYSTPANFYQSPLAYYNNISQNQKQKIKQPSQKQKHKQLDAHIKDNKSKHQIYLPEQNKYYFISTLNEDSHNTDLKIFHDTYFLCGQYNKILSLKKTKQVKQSKQTKQSKTTSNNQNLNNDKQGKQSPIVWNKNWKIFPVFEQYVAKNTEQIYKVWKDAEQLILRPPKRVVRNNSLSNTKNIQRAVEVQRKWEQLTSQLQDNQTNKTKMLSMSSFKLPSNMGKMNNSKFEKNQSNITEKDNRLISKHKSLYKNESSPYIRLGLALQKINQRDQKAAKFIQIGEKKNIDLLKNLKLPKINSRVD